MKPQHSRALQIIVLLIVALLFYGSGATAVKWAIALRQPDALSTFEALIDGLGLWGIPALLVIQYIQIVLAFLPGGPVQMVAGALYGPLAGLLLCLTGMVLATATIFALARRYGVKILSLFVGQADSHSYRVLQKHNAKRLEQLVLLLFFLPGTPKDALTYFFALTPIPFSRFLLLSAVARLPAMVASLFAGDSLREGDWYQAGILFFLMTLLGIVGFLVYHRLHKNKDDSGDDI